MTNFSVQDASGATKEFKATSGDGSGGSPFVSEVGLADIGETVDVGRVNLIGTAQSNGAVRATGATIPAYAVAMGASDGTNLQIPVCDASKFLKVVLQAGTAAVGNHCWHTARIGIQSSNHTFSQDQSIAWQQWLDLHWRFFGVIQQRLCS